MFEIVDSVGMRFSILNAFCMGTTQLFVWEARMMKHGLWENPTPSVLHRHMHVCELSYMAGRVGLVAKPVRAVIVEHTIEAYSVCLLPGTVW